MMTNDEREEIDNRPEPLMCYGVLVLNLSKFITLHTGKTKEKDW